MQPAWLPQWILRLALWMTLHASISHLDRLARKATRQLRQVVLMPQYDHHIVCVQDCFRGRIELMIASGPTDPDDQEAMVAADFDITDRMVDQPRIGDDFDLLELQSHLPQVIDHAAVGGDLFEHVFGRGTND